MSLAEKLKTDLNQALKSGEGLKIETLRGLLAAIHNREIELRGTRQEEGIDDEDVLNVLTKEAKKRKEAGQIYAEAGRTDLAEKESKELEIIKDYLPPEMSADEIEAIVRRMVEEGATDFGQVMGRAMKETKGRAEAGTVKEIVERVLGNRN